MSAMREFEFRDWFKVVTLVIMCGLAVYPSIAWHEVRVQRQKLEARVKEWETEIDAKQAESRRELAEAEKLTAENEKLMKYDPANCHPVEVKKTQSGCAWSGDGVYCGADFMQPETWGRCLMEKDQSFDCAKDGALAHYGPKKTAPDWTLPTKSCPALAQQIDKFGQDPAMGVTIPMPKPKTVIRGRGSLGI
jgi:hypothetical protein